VHVITAVTKNTVIKWKTWQGFKCVSTLKMQLLLVVTPHAVACLKFQTLSLGWGTRWCSWLRHCATSRKVAGSIPDGVIGIFHWHNPSGRTMALGSTQPLTEMSTRNISWGWRRPVRRADNLTTHMCWLSWNPGASTSWNPQGLSRPVMGLLHLTFLSLGYEASDKWQGWILWNVCIYTYWAKNVTT